MAKRTRITRPYPTHSFQDALPVAETIQRVNGGQPVETELLAEALGTSAKSSTFVQKLNASSKYGMTIGSYSDSFIELTELGESVTAPGSPQERNESVVDAVTNPQIFREFYRIYSGKRMPEDIYASNTLVRELGVPRELTEECLGIIRRNGLVSGLVSDQSGVLVVRTVAESEEAGYYGAEPSSGPGPYDDGECEDVGGRPGNGTEILVVSGPDDPMRGDVNGLVEGLSVPCKSVGLESVSGGRIISQELSDALDSARGCIFVWPTEPRPDVENQTGPIAWATLGAVSYRLGDRLIVLVGDDGDDTAFGLVSGDPVTTVVRAAGGESVYPKLMAALVQTGIVRISVG